MRRDRMLVRLLHIALGVSLALVVYLPTAWTDELRLALATIGVPLVATTGLVLWQRARIIRWFGSVAVPLAFVAAVGVAVGGQVLLQRTFATVRHVVPLGAVNAQANAEVVRGWHARLIEQGTLDRMIATELVDLVWVAGLAASVVLLTLLASGALRHRNPAAADRLRRVAPFTALAPGLDVVENAISLAMLADPLAFPAVLASAHAAVSVAKVVAIVGTLLVVPGYALFGAIAGRGSWTASREAGRGHGGARQALPSRVP